MVIEQMIQQTVQETTKAMKEAVVIYIAENGQLAIKSNMNGKLLTMGVLLNAVNVIAMKNEEPKSAIIKPTTEQVAKVALH